MNNKKGFTIIEVVLAFTFAVILLASMFVIVINYQNRAEKEKIISNLLTYKNGILEIVYQDVISNDIDSMSQCGPKCIEIKTSTETFKLEGKVDDASGNNYLTYRGNNYVLPDSNNNLSKIDNFEYISDNIENSDESKIFKVNIPVIHAELDDEENDENTIEIVISGKEFEKPVSKLENPVVVTPIEGLIYADLDYELVEVKKQKGNIYFSTNVLDGSNYNDEGTSNIPKNKDAGTYTVYYYVTGNDDYYSKSGSVTVSIGKRKVTYKADDAKKGYDGTVLEQKTATLIDGTIVEGHTATFDIEGSIIEEGEVPNVLKDVIIKDANGNNVTSNYEITKVNGKLEIELVCEWKETSNDTKEICEGTDKPSNPVKNSTYVACDGPYYGNWRYSSTPGECQHGALISQITTKYNYPSSSKAKQECIDRNSTICSGSYIKSGGSCSTSQKKYYYQIEYTYQCSTTKDTININEKIASYTGSEIPANNAVLASGGNASYVYYPSQDCSGNPLGGAPVNVGNYSVKVISDGGNDYLGNSVCIKHTITVGTPILTLTPKTDLYTGNPISPPVPSAKNESGNPEYLEYDYEYYEGNTCSGTKLTSAPINVGKYSVIAVSRATDNLVSAKSNCVIIEIGQQELGLTATAEDKEYDGNTNAICKLTLNNIKSGDDVKISATGSFDNKNVGNNKKVTCSNITLTGTDAGNYKLNTTSVNATANITAKTLNVADFTYSPLTKVYDKTISAPSGFKVIASTNSGLLNGDTVTISYTGAVYNDADVTDAKSIIVSGMSISGTDSGNYKLSNTSYTKTGATITKATGTITLSSKTATYTGSAIVANTAETNSGGNVTYKYYSGNNCNGAVLNNAPVNAGTYRVIATVEATGNYTSASTGCIAHIINKKILTPSASVDDKVYDGNDDTTCKITLNGIVSGDSVTTTQTTGTFADKNAGTGKKVTCQDIKLTGDDANNYELDDSTIDTTADITPKPLSVSNFTYSPLTKVYDGNKNVPSGFKVSGTTASDLVSGDSITISYTSALYNDANVSKANSIIISGFSITGTNAANYTLNNTSYTKTGATITKATGTINLSPRSESYTGSAIVANTATTNSGGSVTYQYYTENCVSTISGAPTNVGKYGVIATVSATGNYTSAKTECVAHTITNKSSNVVKPNASSHCLNVTYNGSEQTITNTASAEYDFSGNKGIIAKTYTVTATLKAGYTWQDGSITPVTFECSIAQRSVIYKADDATKVYDGSALTKKTMTLMKGELVSGHIATPNISGSITNVGETVNELKDVIIESGTADVSSNYDITLQNGTLKVTKADNGISITGVSVNENGSEQNLIGNVSGANGTVYYSLDGPLNDSNYTTGDTDIPTAIADGTYIVYYYVTGDSNHNSESGSVTSTLKKVTTAPSCSFSGPSTKWLRSDEWTTETSATFTLNCTDSYNFTDSTLTTSDFTLNTQGIVSLSAPVKSTITGGFQYVITVTGLKEGSTTLSLKAGTLSNALGNGNSSVTSASIGVDDTLPTVTFDLAEGTFTIPQTVNISASDTGGSGFYYMDIHVQRDGIFDDSKSVTTYFNSSYSVTLEPGYTWLVHANVYDKARNKQDKNPQNNDGWYFQTYKIYSWIVVTYDSTNLITGFSNVSNVAVDHGVYSYNNGTLTLTGNDSDGYVYTNGGASLVAGRSYKFSVNTDGTWGGTVGDNTVEAFMYNAATGTHIHMDSPSFTFTPSETGTFTLRFDVNGTATRTFTNISVNEISTRTFKYEDAYTFPVDPIRTGYTFAGWFTDPTGGSSVGPGMIVTNRNSHTLYAHWTQSFSCSLTYEHEDGIFRVIPYGGSGNYTYSFNGGSYGSNDYIARSEANAATATVKDSSSGATATCNISCTFDDWALSGSQFYYYDMSVPKATAEASNLIYYRHCNTATSRVCQNNGIMAEGICYKCALYGRGITCG